MLEKSQVFRSEDILVSLMISAVVCDYPFIAEMCNLKNWCNALTNLNLLEAFY